jgi:non-reducing end alpha-L-arabinofuranosidase
MKTRISIAVTLALALALIGATSMMATQAGAGRSVAPPRPAGPCDIYAAAGDPCVAAHSTTRALYASYNGPLYRVLRQSDLRTLDIGVVQPVASPVPDAGGYANAAAQDAFCANTYCWITTIYDQSPRHNDLVQAPRGGFSGPAMGGFNNLPIADMAPITIMGHKAYGVFIAPGMGLRQNDAKGTAVDDQAEGQYWVVNGHHYNSGCCFDYGNAETDSRDDGDGTMETTYYGNATAWYRGQPPGPWIMTDQENNLVGCVNASPNDKSCPNLPSITWRFVTATADGEPHHWRSMGGDAQTGDLKIMFDGPRIKNDRNSYDPMRKQGAILLGNGGDNSVGSQGTFYEGAMTAAGTFPTADTNQKVQANVVAARYDVARLSLAPAFAEASAGRPASATAVPPGLQTFSPGSSHDTTVTFTNTTGAPATGVRLSVSVPAGWNSAVSGATGTSRTFADPVAPGASVSATFKVTSGPAAFNGDLVGRASWTNKAGGPAQTEMTVQKVRNVSPIKINEFRVSAGSPANPTNSFIELHNAGASAVDISNWTLTQHQTQQAPFSAVKIPAGTTLAAGGFYLLGLSNSGLAVPARAGDTTIHVRSTTGMSVGDTIDIDAGTSVETRRIASLGTAAGNPTTLWQPVPDGPVMTIPVGSTNVPVTSANGFAVGEKIAIGHGATYPAVAKGLERYEVATVTAVGKQGTQGWLSMDAKAGDTNIKVSSVANISVGDKIRLDIASVGHGIETVTVTKVGTQSVRNTFAGPLRDTEDPGTGLDLAAPLKFNHASNMPFSARGTGITFKPATSVAHSSNEPVLPLGTGITLDKPLAMAHAIDAAVRDAAVTTAGYQGTPAPNRWFGGPALSPSAGTMVLRNAAGLVVDSLNYGLLVDPWASEGYHGTSGAGQGGCRVPAPGQGGPGFGARGGAAPAVNTPHRSAGRFPDGFDTDSNCNDFLLQPATILSAASAAGATNVKVASVADFVAGQAILIDAGASLEKAVVATVGTPGATAMSAATTVGATIIPVAGGMGFAAGQTITIDSGGNQETAVVASTGRGGPGGPGGGPGGATITVTAPLKSPHAAGAQVSGSGITLTAALTQAHASGAQVATNLPTPGAPNRYERARR